MGSHFSTCTTKHRISITSSDLKKLEIRIISRRKILRNYCVFWHFLGTSLVMWQNKINKQFEQLKIPAKWRKKIIAAALSTIKLFFGNLWALF